MGGLFQAARADAPDAVAELHRIVGGFARRVCRGGGPSGSPELDWEDVAQETCRKLHAVGLEQYHGGGSERSYLYSMVKATVIQMARSSSRRQRRELAVAPGPLVVSPDHHARLDVRRILDKLDAACRDLIERMFLREESYADAARELGLVESSVRAKLCRCLKRARGIATEGSGS